MAVPSLSQIRIWSSEHLRQGATQWAHAADAWEESFTSISREIAAPGGYPWTGAAADAAQSTAKLDRLKVQRLVDCVRSASSVAAGAVGEIEAAKAATLHAVGEAYSEGFIVAEDLSLTDRFSSSTSAESVARQSLADLLAAQIQQRAAALAAADEAAAARIVAATAELQGFSTGSSGAPDGSAGIQMVDFIGAPFPEKPSWTSPGEPPGGWSDDPVTRAAQKIAYGHASTKHLASEWPPGTTREQLASEVERIIRAGANPNGGMIVGRTGDGAPAIYDPKTNTLIIRDKGAADAGTAFKPTRGSTYVDTKVPTRVPFIPSAELADPPPRPPVEPPRAEPQIPRSVPRVGLPPMGGVPPVVGLPGAGAGDIPVVDVDGTPNPRLGRS